MTRTDAHGLDRVQLARRVLEDSGFEPDFPPGIDDASPATDPVAAGATDKGTFVRLLHPAAEGRVIRHEQGLDVGDAVKVRLVATEPTRGFVDFEAIR